MKPNINAIKEFLEDHRGCYLNRNNIDFDRMDDSIMVSFTDYHNPERKYVDFFLSYEKSIRQFITDFSIKVPQDLDKVTIDCLWDLFWQGKGKIYCGLDFSLIRFSRYFKCADQTLFSIDDNNVIEEITESLKSIDDFTNYTHQKFQNSSSSSHNSSCMPHSSL